MFEFLRTWITAVVGMVIFMTVIDLILPHNNGFKKYVSLVTGLIVMITILTPVFKLLDKNNDVQASIARFTQEFDNRAREVDRKKYQEDLNTRTLEVFKEKLKASMEGEIYKSTGKKYVISRLDIVEDSESIDFASVKALELTVSYSDGTVKPVDNVNIGGEAPKVQEFRDEKVVSFLKEKFDVNPSVVKFKK